MKSVFNEIQEVNEGSEIHEVVYGVLVDGKASDILVYKAAEGYFVDFMVIATCTSPRHAQSLSEKLEMALKHQCGSKVKTYLGSKEWIVIDSEDIMIHLMTPEKRVYFNIEEVMEERKNKILTM